jgi:hypothetical protein
LLFMAHGKRRRIVIGSARSEFEERPKFLLR